MLNWHDMAVWYANERASKLGIAPRNYTTFEDLAEKGKTHPSFHSVPITIDLEIPVFTSLDTKDLRNIGVSLSRIC
jgi:hypothetical protein